MNVVKCLDFVMSDAINKIRVFQKSGVDIMVPASNFIQNENPAKVTSCESLKKFHSVTLLKRKSVAGVFLQVSRNYSGYNLI